jgi:hypothetical protein
LKTLLPPPPANNEVSIQDDHRLVVGTKEGENFDFDFDFPPPQAAEAYWMIIRRAPVFSGPENEYDSGQKPIPWPLG